MSAATILTARSRAASLPWLEIGPMLVFFAAFQLARPVDPDGALLIAAAAFALSALLALFTGFRKDGRVSAVLLASTVVIVGTAALAGLSGSKLFLFMRPTVINGGLGLGLLLGVAAGVNPARRLLGGRVALPDTVWTRLAVRWGLFFIVVAIANEYVWRTQTEAVWITVKTFGFAPLTALFSLLQWPLIRRHAL